MSFLWKIGGEAGYGINTSGLLIAKVAARSGYHLWDYAEYPSLIRGGHNTMEVHISGDPVRSSKKPVDLLVCLNEETYRLHQHRLHADSVTVYDPDVFQPADLVGKSVPLPVKKILLEQRGLSIMGNMITFGASLALMGADEEVYAALIREQFEKKGEEVVQGNLNMVKVGIDFVKQNHADLVRLILAAPLSPPTGEEEKKPDEEDDTNQENMPQRTRGVEGISSPVNPHQPPPGEVGKGSLVIAANEAFSLGAVAADCRFYCSYPMTPASSVLTYLSSVAEKCGMVVKQGEDEIAVINTALGSSFAGVRSAVGTSGGGFALMVESISLSGIIETPIVIFLSQRPGPATGVPTWTEQGDLLFAVHAGHGDFPKIVLAPGDVEEMVALTLKAFDLADQYQLPVIVMSDKVLSESHQDFPIARFEELTKNYTPDRGKITSVIATLRYSEGEAISREGPEKNDNVRPPPDSQSSTDNHQSSIPYLRYAITDDGVSPMLIPGTPGAFYQANSYEHLEDSHTTEDMAEIVKQVEKRSRKEKTYLERDFALPEIFGDLDKADTILVSWGGNKGVILDALQLLTTDYRLPTAFIHFTHLYPLDEEKLKPLFEKKKRYILIENNESAQFARLLRQQTGITIEEKLLKYDGQPIFREEIVAQVQNAKFKV